MEIYFVHVDPLPEPVTTTTTTTNGDLMDTCCNVTTPVITREELNLLHQRVDSLETLILDLAEHLKVEVKEHLPSDVMTFEIVGNKKRS